MTDHRAEAEEWLHHATTVTSHDEAVLEALIGIGHALLAGPEKPTAIVHLAGNATRQQLRDLLQPPAPPLSPSEG